jgi:hypothetical protein
MFEPILIIADHGRRKGAGPRDRAAYGSLLCLPSERRVYQADRGIVQSFFEVMKQDGRVGSPDTSPTHPAIMSIPVK